MMTVKQFATYASLLAASTLIFSGCILGNKRAAPSDYGNAEMEQTEVTEEVVDSNGALDPAAEIITCDPPGQCTTEASCGEMNGNAGPLCDANGSVCCTLNPGL